MGRGEEEELRAARRGYKEAARVGNHEEKARWANELGDIHKRRGEYVEALRWLRVDYEISSKHLPQKQLLPTCQSIGEVYLRLNRLKEALVYQVSPDMAKCMEDEDALVNQINQNIKTVKEAAKVLEELNKDERKLKKLMRSTSDARGTSNERKCLLEQNACLDGLIEKARIIFAWPKGQALVKINIGQILDASGDWAGALEAFEEGYRFLFLELYNTKFFKHVCFRKLQQDIQMLKPLLKEDALKDQQSDYCSETETEGGNLSTDILRLSASQDSNDSGKSRPSLLACVEDLDDDVPLASLGHSNKSSTKIKMSQLDSLDVRTNASSNHAQASSRDLSKSRDDQRHVDRKRVRVVLSDDEADDPDEMNGSRQKLHRSSEYGTAPDRECDIVILMLQFVKVKVGHDLIHVDLSSCLEDGNLDIECLKVEVACTYFLQLPEQKRSKGAYHDSELVSLGLFPVIGCLMSSGKALGPSEVIEDIEHQSCESIWIDVVIDVIFVFFCTSHFLIKVSEDEVVVSDCELQDVSVSPFLQALQAHKTLAVLDISHNLLGTSIS
ncbi:hypothetical protein B296_00045112 [Ensete ventricosum]|uniref:Protein TONSOKU n=1 Tax=Ensete ventricosum TaxID=4639 RepID=A0A426Z8G5_ENSVE|nr:hypothetical protein B296_00045112 [Ensete ventricosum]